MGQPELSRRRRMLVLAICCLSLFIVGLDDTIVNVALPSIRRDLHASGLRAAVDGRRLHAGAGQPADAVGLDRRPGRPAPDLPDRSGLIFTLGSLLCSLAPSLGWLVAFRMLQAVGGSMLNPVAMSIITNTFTDRGERARAIGVWGARRRAQPWRSARSLGGALVSVGRLAVDLLDQHPGRHRRDHRSPRCFVPESRAPRARRLDPVGQLLVIADAGLADLRRSSKAPASGWTSPEIVSAVRASSVVALTCLISYEPRPRRAADRAEVLPQRAVLRARR